MRYEWYERDIRNSCCEKVTELAILVAPTEVIGKRMVELAGQRATKQKSSRTKWRNHFVCELIRMIQDGLVFDRWVADDINIPEDVA